jgi:DNA-directed RNA polymerase subunit K/omega
MSEFNDDDILIEKEEGGGDGNENTKKELNEDSDFESEDENSDGEHYNDNNAQNGGDDDDDDDEEDEDDEKDPEEFEKAEKNDNVKPSFIDMDIFSEDNDSDEETDEDDEDYLQKFDEDTQKNIIAEYHPELHTHNNLEIENMCRVVRDENGTIIDSLHKTVPFITRYEKARVLGERAKQLNSGAKPLISVDVKLLDGYIIALKEYEVKKIPFIIKRPLPNGGCEYWKISDLEQI